MEDQFGHLKDWSGLAIRDAPAVLIPFFCHLLCRDADLVLMIESALSLVSLISSALSIYLRPVIGLFVDDGLADGISQRVELVFDLTKPLPIDVRSWTGSRLQSIFEMGEKLKCLKMGWADMSAITRCLLDCATKIFALGQNRANRLACRTG